ncbi:Rieske (2Fe-2S) protein [Micromonospora inyonensis]|uniref:Ferredoxin subunit of nitrite reductase or a ring-hydroxylating dioxygenase n=1 Tax=Micromonospora inyonensis TaxID=47866 RepID=A0A1C6S473_9ACTN|nr:Rieske (2Fe-2S) protein [Micromonospora inyonensis]SCL24084.1 Ferredoxin subunit of nitrite reductase or a ring-hydroxylating dioxygenase [Micromonospora inyonensis]
MSDDNGLTGPATRRTLLAGAGAVGAAVVLTACGGDDEPAGSGSAAPTSGGPGVSPSADAGGDRSAADAIVGTADVPVGGGVIFASKGVVVTQPSAGVFKGFSPICTHQKCPVSRIDGGTIICTCHNSKFSIEDGSVKGGPAKQPLPAKEIVVDGDQIRLA